MTRGFECGCVAFWVCVEADGGSVVGTQNAEAKIKADHRRILIFIAARAWTRGPTCGNGTCEVRKVDLFFLEILVLVF